MRTVMVAVGETYKDVGIGATTAAINVEVCTSLEQAPYTVTLQAEKGLWGTLPVLLIIIMLQVFQLIARKANLHSHGIH